MKRTLLALCALTAVAGSSHAQVATSTPFGVTLFGIVDVDVRAVKNGSAGTQKAVGSDGLNSSRLGFRGYEDLGSGLKAGFWLEAPIAPDTGTANATRFWNRRSTVSLIDPTFGEIRLGRDNTPAFTAYAVYDPFGTNGLAEILGNGGAANGTGVGIISGLGSGAQTLSRSDNQVSYFLPAILGGVYGQFAIAPSEGVVGGRYASGRLGYASGGLDISAAYTETRVALENKLKQGLIGAAYDFGVLKLSGQVIQAKFDSLAGGDRRQLVYQLGASVPFGVSVVRVDFIHGDMKGGAAGTGFGDADDANQFAIGYQYNLSKRTALYATAVTLRNKGTSRLTVAAGNPGMKPGENSSGYDLGIRHTF